VNRRVIPLRRIGGTVSEMSDEALVAACATGESAALGALFDRHHAAVRRFLARVSGASDSDLDDLVQITFATVPRAAARWGRRATARTWLFGVANNVARHHARSEIRRRRRIHDAAECLRSFPAEAGADALARERALRLSLAIVELPPKLREAFVLVYLEGVPGAEAAQLLGVRGGTIWKRLHQARARLRETLGGSLP
jgi:RNA polymerase sigma-70 factor (ECF subfamily)